MGFWRRLWGDEELPRPVRVAVVGQGAEAGRLAAAYATSAGIELVQAQVVKPGDGVIRQPVVETPALESLAEVIATPGLEAVELAAPLGERAAAAAHCLRAGLFTSVEAPATEKELDELATLSRAYHTPLRLRLHPLYYPVYQEFKRLLDQDYAGHPLSLKMMIRRGKGTLLSENLDPAAWLLEHELGFLCLAPWLLGDIVKVHARLQPFDYNRRPASSIIMFQFRQRRLYGFLQLDFCPGLHVRTFSEPVHRYLELTGVGGLLIASRGEGQLLRMPALILRAKSTTTAFELTPDDWSEVYRNLARETVRVKREKAEPLGSAQLARAGLELVTAARASATKGDEVELA
jgi:predicted dehydrogenase